MAQKKSQKKRTRRLFEYHFLKTLHKTKWYEFYCRLSQFILYQPLDNVFNETCREPSKHLSKQNAWISARKTRSTTTGRGFTANFSRTKYARPNMVFSVAQLFFSTFPSFQTLLLVKLLVRLHKNSRSNSVSSCPGS